MSNEAQDFAKLATRQEVLEQKFGAMQATQSEHGLMIREVRDAIIKQQGDTGRNGSQKPDILKIVGAVLGAYTVVIGIVAGSLSLYLAPDRQELARVKLEVQGIEVLKYRVQLLEGKKELK